MNANNLTIEIESRDDTYTKFQILLSHPFIDDIFYRYNWKRGKLTFDPVWSCDDREPDNGKRVCMDFVCREIEGYEQEKREHEAYYRNWKSDAEEQYMNY